ncbi:MAG: DUF4838 domain-containing protein [Firmicutes bacterium]|nr:DUF4838 domain-containing protein [Bacillota bacterium]
MTYRRIRFGQIGNGRATDFAILELTKYLKKMDPQLVVDVLKMDAINTAFKGIIWVGQDESLVAQLPTVNEPALDDGIAIAVKDGEGYITGTNERSVLLAAYRFLKELGCNWVRPGAEGERIPAKEIENVNVEVKEAPSYRHRGVCIEGAITYENVYDMVDYLPKVGMNEYYVQFWVPCSFFNRWYWHDTNPYLEREDISIEEVDAMTRSLENEIARRGISYQKTGHGWTCDPFGIDGSGWNEAKEELVPPEGARQYLAEVNGKRDFWYNVPLNTNLCYSNPVVRKTMTDAMADYCKKNPHVDTLHFWLADGSNNHCECEECRKKRPSDWYVMMLNELDEKLTAAGLDTKVVFLIYVDLLWEPTVETIKNQDRFILMFAPITRSFGLNYSDFIEYNKELPEYTRNHLPLPTELSQNLEHLRRWQKVFKGDSFDYDYHLMWAHASDPGYERCAKNVFQDMQQLHKIGIQGMLSAQVHRVFYPTALPFNMMAAALWDETCDYEEKALAYYEAAFGEDGKLVHEYLSEISDLMLVYVNPALSFEKKQIQPPFCKDYDRIKQVIEDFAPVIRRNAAIPGCYQEDWQILEIHIDYVKMFVRCYELAELGDWEGCHKQVYELLDYVNRNEIKLQKVQDGENIEKVLKSRLGLGDFATTGSLNI